LQGRFQQGRGWDNYGRGKMKMQVRFKIIKDGDGRRRLNIDIIRTYDLRKKTGEGYKRKKIIIPHMMLKGCKVALYKPRQNKYGENG
jgi:hypothetical protein